MGLKLITAPATTPVTLAEAKVYLNISDTSQDTKLTALIAAATSYLDGPSGYLGRAIYTQTWELHLDDFPDAIEIPLGPVASVSSVKYYDTASVLQTISTANYQTDLISSSQWIVPISTYTWPDVAEGINNVVIQFVAGSATPPEAIKVGILMLVADWFDAPEASSDKAMSEMPHRVAAVLSNHRAYGV